MVWPRVVQPLASPLLAWLPQSVPALFPVPPALKLHTCLSVQLPLEQPLILLPADLLAWQWTPAGVGHVPRRLLAVTMPLAAGLRPWLLQHVPLFVVPRVADLRRPVRRPKPALAGVVGAATKLLAPPSLPTLAQPLAALLAAMPRLGRLAVPQSLVRLPPRLVAQTGPMLHAAQPSGGRPAASLPLEAVGPQASMLLAAPLSADQPVANLLLQAQPLTEGTPRAAQPLCAWPCEVQQPAAARGALPPLAPHLPALAPLLPSAFQPLPVQHCRRRRTAPLWCARQPAVD